MTQEQYDTAAGSVLRQYREAQARHAILAVKAQNWGRLFSSLGKALTPCGDALPNLDLSNFPDKAEVLGTQDELSELNTEIAQLRKSLNLMGAL